MQGSNNPLPNSTINNRQSYLTINSTNQDKYKQSEKLIS
jgi:hypothetical protein